MAAFSTHLPGLVPRGVALPTGVPEFDDLVTRLRRPDVFPGRPRQVEVVETHISVVFLTDHEAYKLKKPVRFEFLDYSTAERRRAACEAEVRLNRRMAPQVYRGVVPVTLEASGRVALAGTGQPIDWLVHMRRLPREQFLDERIRQGRLSDVDLARLTRTLDAFYLRASPVMARPEQYLSAIERHVRANRAELLAAAELPRPLVQRVHAAQLRWLALHHELLRARVLDGRLIDGHGDLRPEHIALVEPPAVYDCIEFSAELRQIDVLDELAFLAMECDALGAAEVGRRVLESFIQASGDHPTAGLIEFYKSYRACVRAKVAVLRARQGSDTHDAAVQVARRYLDLADSYPLPERQPLVLVVGGLMGSGKSTLARELADRLGMELLQTDVIRRAMFPPDAPPELFGTGRYAPGQRDTVYAALLERADALLADGVSVILDGTFLRAAPRLAAAALAARRGAAHFGFECVCPREIALERIAERQFAGRDASEARPEWYDRQRAEHEPDGPPLAVIDTTSSLQAQLDQVLARLRDAGRTDALNLARGAP